MRGFARTIQAAACLCVASARNDIGEPYKILTSEELFGRLRNLVTNYPTFATLTTTQEWFGLPRAGNQNDCKFDTEYSGPSGEGCNNYVLIIQDKDAYPDDSDLQQLESRSDYYLSKEDGWFNPANTKYDAETHQKSGWKYLPDVFLSGAVHGNERVGPTALMEMAELLLEAAYCESLPRTRYRPQPGSTRKPLHDSNGEEVPLEYQWKEEVMTGKMCRDGLVERGVTAPNRQWLARLVSTRRTVIIPTANALGYFRNTREEDHIDPNRDFPFDVQKPTDCMQTIAGRSINELFRSHLFPIGLTFHGGMEVVAYEWGAPTYYRKDSPGQNAQEQIAGAYSRYANGFRNHVAYDFGTMNDKVYYVRGGMEDWAFAGSWDPDRVMPCQPTTFGGYDTAKTKYNNSTLRAFNMLVETSDIKEPPQNQLGKRTMPLESSNDENNGHIARNIRLALLAMDVVEPYVSIRTVEDIKLDDDVVPAVNLRRYDGKSHRELSPTVWVPHTLPKTTISWTVGGSFEIDETEILVGPWDLLPSSLADVKDGLYPSTDMIESLVRSEFTTVSASNVNMKQGIMGTSRWHKDGPAPRSRQGDQDDENWFGPYPIFTAEIDTSHYPEGTSLVVLARAKVDKSWLTQRANVGPPGLGSLSHIVNGRNNPNYFAANAGKVIRGKRDNWWYSNPVTVMVGSSADEEDLLDESNEYHAPSNVDTERHVRAIHINARMASMPSAMEKMHDEELPKAMEKMHDEELPKLGPGSSMRDEKRTAPGLGGSKSTDTSFNMPMILGVLGLIIGVGLLLIIRRRRSHRMRMGRLSNANGEDDGFSMSSYRDRTDDLDLEEDDEDPRGIQ